MIKFYVSLQNDIPVSSFSIKTKKKFLRFFENFNDFVVDHCHVLERFDILIFKKNHDQKRILTPKQAFKNGSDWLVIGRPLTKGNIKKNIQKLIDHLNQ